MSQEEEKAVNEAEGAEAEEKEEGDVVDEELQKEMKGIKIDESDFGEVNKPKKKDRKEDKKAKKKKGEDFIDYANKNNIQINIEYEENKYELKKTVDPKVDNPRPGKPNENKRGRGNNFSRGGYRGGYRGRQQKRPFKFNSGNKFDMINQRPPYQMGQGNYYQQQHQIPALTEDKDILNYLETIFGEENLNKDSYLRNRIDSKKGTILVDNIVAYNVIKKNNINKQKILDVIKESANLDSLVENEKDYIHIKNYNDLKLISMEQLTANKKSQKIKMNYPQPIVPQMPFAGCNYINNYQNNYIVYQPPFNTPQYISYPENK